MILSHKNKFIFKNKKTASTSLNFYCLKYVEKMTLSLL